MHVTLTEPFSPREAKSQFVGTYVLKDFSVASSSLTDKGTKTNDWRLKLSKV